MSRGFTKEHGTDVHLKFRFVDRGGRYVYEIYMGPQRQLMGSMRIDWEQGDVTAMALLDPKIQDAKMIDPAQLPLPFVDPSEDSDD